MNLPMTQLHVTRIDPSKSVASIVLAHSECAPQLQQLRIDFCCKGEQSLQSACEARGLAVATVVDALSKSISVRAGQTDGTVGAAKLSNADLIGHIVTKHHAYLRQALPFIVPLAAKVARVHGEHNPRLLTLSEVVHALDSALMPHLDQEEQDLFPLLLDATTTSETIESELRRMKAEHLAVGDLLNQLRDAAEEFSVPDWACTSYRTLFAELERLELDILQHVHLENHVLAPRFE
jgi:regulator of cell morphogenesis and NO signaling